MVAFFAIATSLLLALPSVLAEPAGLYARQLGVDPSTLPTACQSQCKPLSDIGSSGTCVTLQCLCTTAIANSLKSCLQCAVGANIAGFNQTTADTAVSGFATGCAAAGYPISGVSTGTGSSGSPSSSPAAAGTASGSAASSSSTGAATTKGSNAIAKTTISILGAVFAVAFGSVAFA